MGEEVQLDRIVADKSSEYAEMTESMGISVHLDIHPTVILFHQQLAEIIIGNLFNNAIRYNKRGGHIDIALEHNLLTIANTSANDQLDYSKLYKRFYRPHSTDEGNGLGLSIVKQICDMAGFTIVYKYAEGLHSFQVAFDNSF